MKTKAEKKNDTMTATTAPTVLNMSQLAREVGVSRSHVNLILNKERMPSLPVAGKLARAMGITLDELHGRLVAVA